jgi:hypothetical protein
MMKLLKIFILSLIVGHGGVSYSQAVSETFIVRSFDQRVEVLAPSKFHPEQVVVIENRTTEDLIGYVQTEDGKTTRHIRVKPSKTTSVNLPGQNAQRFIFVPMSPPFQEVELVIGKEAYEIPPKR